jgi:hypothetical protein
VSYQTEHDKADAIGCLGCLVILLVLVPAGIILWRMALRG